MKLKYIFLALITITFASCNKEEEKVTETTSPATVIENVEIGVENSKIGYAESDLHLEAQISSEVGVKSIRVQILPQRYGNAWFVDKTYFWEGKKEGDLHHHYDIPKKAITTGSTEAIFDVIITVTDLNGKKTIIEDTLKVINDPNLPKISNGSQSYDPITKQVTLKAKIKAPNVIKEVRVKIGTAVNQTFNTPRYVGQTEVDFEEIVDGSNIRTPNHFHSHLTVVDEKGKEFVIDLGAH